ncbi:diguanylate phosphodiesterase [Herbaspirillum sp. meg3]|uniref:EAL domain-containing response regulator n=1 Tax=Herbaspirillum sp. meg3 TaxID=2025949 RepID=UPI000B98ED9B|nr:EAL domain-containing response regulator [Herbaspirillum sp. meg3]ASU39550.1 diguanylate phosphodiesterase [Herbaspirillum sp. meg3]
MRTIADLSILIVEDEPLQRAFIAAKIKELGAIDVRDATDGLDAMVMLRARAADLLLCDIGMPNMDGSQFVLAQTALPMRSSRDLPMLIWMSVHDGDLLESHLQMARSAGFPFVDTLAKPVNSVALSAAVDGALVVLNARSAVPQKTSKSTRFFFEDAINEDDILRAICDTSEFEVWYQPHISLKTKMVTGADALVRWSHPKFSGLSPGQFMALIEKQGLGLMLFYRTFNHVLKTQQKLAKLGCSMPICVKASATTLEAPEIADYLYERIQRHEIAPSLIVVGMSEEEPPQQALQLAASINRLRLRGLGLSIDDFGSGISTMKLLSQMPFTEIRIDGHFVRQFLRQAQCRVMVESIIDIARRLKLKVTAEGIENARQMEVLAAMGCLYGQGPIAKPMQQDEFLSSVGAAHLFNNGLVDA